MDYITIYTAHITNKLKQERAAFITKSDALVMAVCTFDMQDEFLLRTRRKADEWITKQYIQRTSRNNSNERGPPLQESLMLL